MNAKERHKIKLLEYMGNPDNEFPSREEMALTVLGFSKKQTMWRHFTPDELTEIEKEALEIRRRKYVPRLAKIDMALIKEAEGGSEQAIKLAYQRFEGWSEKQIREHTGKDGGPIEQKWTNFPEPAKDISDWERQVRKADGDMDAATGAAGKSGDMPS